MGENGNCCVIVFGLISIAALAISITSIVLVFHHKSGDASLSSEYHEIAQQMQNLQESVDRLQGELGESNRKVAEGLSMLRDEVRRNFTTTQDAYIKLNAETLDELDKVNRTVVKSQSGLNALDKKLGSISTSVDIVYEVKRELGNGTLTTIKENFDDLKSRLESLENVNIAQWALIIMELVVIVLLCCLFHRKIKALSKSLGLDAKNSRLV